MTQAPVTITTKGDIGRNFASFRRAVAPPFKSPNTAATYAESARQFIEFVVAKGMPQDVTNVRREHVEAFVQELSQSRSAATANNRYRGLQAFFRFLVEEGEIRESPMRNMTPPKVPIPVVPVLPEESLTKLIGSCKGDSFADRRDAALLRLFASTGARRSELLELRVSETRPEENDVDLDMGVARVRGKGGRDRLLPLGPKAARALDRYLRARARHPDAHQPWLWLGKRGKLTMNGVRHIFDKRAAAAGLGRVHPHQLRHSFAHHYLSNGGNETDLQRIAGWRSPEMLRRYGESAAQGRALENSKKVGLDDRI